VTLDAKMNDICRPNTRDWTLRRAQKLLDELQAKGLLISAKPHS